MSGRSRIIAIFGTVAMLGGAYLWFFGVQTFCTLEAWNTARKMPVVRITPTELPDSSVSRTIGRKLSYFGYEFEVPWDDIDESKSRVVGGNRAIICFRSGNVLSVWSGSPHEFVATALSSGKIDREIFRQMYGDAALQSDYAFHRIMLEATPNKITPFVPKRQAVSESVLMLMKAISAPRCADSGIFAVRAGEFKGFQYGRPQNAASYLNVDLYSDSGSLDFIFGHKNDAAAPLTQGDVNRILQTLHKVSGETLLSESSAKSSPQ